jgi:hypothetical protein
VTLTSILPASTVVTTQLSVSSAAGVMSTYYTTQIVTLPASTYTYISTLISTEPRTITATSYAPPTTLPGPTTYQTVTLTSTLPASTYLVTQTVTSSAPGTTAISTYVTTTLHCQLVPTLILPSLLAPQYHTRQRQRHPLLKQSLQSHMLPHRLRQRRHLLRLSL